jgi:hypothetical protein
MQEKHLFEYAVIRIVPRVEREEFLNIGVILYCPDHQFLQTKYDLNKEKLLAFYDGIDVKELQQRLHAFEQVCMGIADGGPIGKLPVASRFRWLTATRSTIIQLSPVHSGLCIEPGETLTKLFTQLVR